MKAKNTIRTILSFILVLIMCISMPMLAFAEDTAEGSVVETSTEGGEGGSSSEGSEGGSTPTVESATVNNSDGTTTEVTTTTSTSTDADGNTVVTVTVEKDTSGTLNDGSNANIVREESRTDTTSTDENGNIIKESFVEDGKETKSYEEADKGNEAGQPEVEVPLIPGETTTGEAVSTETTGDTPKDENDKNYDYTETTTTEREVTATTGELTIESTAGEVELKPVAPETFDDVKRDEAGTPITDENGNTIPTERQGYYADGTKKEEIANREDYFDRYGYHIVEVTDPETKEVSYELYDRYGDKLDFENDWDGEFQYSGYGDYAEYIKIAYNIISYQKENGEILRDENGKPLTSSTSTTTDAIQFALQDSEGKLVYAYCVDLETGAEPGAFYDVANLEDNTYYVDEESESHIRAIVSKGYWGTSEGTGSLDQMKADLKDAISKGTVPNTEIEVPKYDENGNVVTDENGNTVMEIMKMSEFIDDLTEGEALAATQAAIWSWSNGSKLVDSGAAGEKVIGVGGWRGVDGNTARMDALYLYLVGLTDDGHNESVVIDENSFLEKDGLKIVVGDKVEDHQDNKDENQDNDVYNADLNFKLTFIPGEKDDLLVQVSYNDLDGNPVTITKRLAGENSGEQSYETILPEEDGSYLLKGLKLSENKDFDFDLKLEGTQYLEKGVYVYSPVGGRTASQTMVGMAEGNRDVDVSIGVTVKFNVDENDKVVAERRWHSEGDPSFTLPETGPEEKEDPTEPTKTTGETGGGEAIIEEEPVPLAKAPGTGSKSGIIAVVNLISGMGLAGLCIPRKSKDEE